MRLHMPEVFAPHAMHPHSLRMPCSQWRLQSGTVPIKHELVDVRKVVEQVRMGALRPWPILRCCC